ncbi:glycosyltransferase [Leptothoe spongobia]|uniref:Glycosyltransferase n=1 Tax=Leptothoe spongobia TAU-MAC 1115 TaxID=1967444 RepID=A0A947DF07_9CYAN|nr:glycosyltransferase [Leptothoe spongobia]MBT9315661.1 glycosyltransferase [Leptothoe spongobia TAU-MAC 1115]
MHILVIPSWYRASKKDTQGSFFREQALALFKHGHQVGIIHSQHRSMRQWQSVVSGRYGFEHEDDGGIPTLRMHSMTWFPRQIPYLNYLLWVHDGLKLYRRYVNTYGKPDVIHAHAMIYGGLLAWNIQTRYKVPFVVTEHGTAYARGLFAPWEIRLASKAVADADCRLAVSEAFCDEISTFLGSHWQACPNVVPVAFTHYPLAPQKKADEPFVFIKVAYLSNKRKRIHLLITAFSQAFKDDPNTYLKIGGDGTERANLAALANDLGVADRVIFLGALERHEVRDHVAESDTLVLASQYETFGVVIIEALALGKPVIATRCGGPNRVVRPQDGLLIPPDDVEAMAQAMRYIKTNRHQYDAQEIRQACIDRYGETAIAEQLEAFYDQTISRADGKQELAQNYA